MQVPQENKTLIVGLGKTGLSCARYLASLGVAVAICDSRENPPGLNELRAELPDIACFLGEFQASVFEATEQLVVSPGVAVSHPLIQQAAARGVPVIGDVELFARAAEAPVVAITGSNGKSTVTTLLGQMAEDAGLRVAVGGNLGQPALELLDGDIELYVLELSSFQLETTHTLAPAVAVVLNVSPDHLDRYDSLDAYATTKAGIYRHAACVILNRDDPLVMQMQPAERPVVSFGLDLPRAGEYGLSQKDGVPWLCCGEQRLLPADQLKMPGRHNIANALAALALGEQVGLPMAAMLETLTRFAGLPHRTQFVAEQDGVRWYNDSKGTNVGATIAALEGFESDADSGRTVLIAGGVSKGADFTPLAPVVARCCRAAVLIGEAMPQLLHQLQGSVELLTADSMLRAVELAREKARPGDRVLLSPACASFDMFSGYPERGECFVAAVREVLT